MNESPYERLASANPAWLGLAELASLVVRVTPSHLRALRLHTRPRLSVDVESETWHSSLVVARGPLGFSWHPLAARWLRSRLATEPSRLTAAWEVTSSFHSVLPPLLVAEERLNYLGSLPHPDLDEARQVLRTLVEAAITAERREGILAWMRRAWGRLPESLLGIPEARLLAICGAAAEARSSDFEPETLRSFNDNRLLETIGTAGITVRRQGSTWIFEDGGRDIFVPATSPRLLAIGSSSALEPVSIPEGGQASRKAAANAETVAIDGSRWSLTASVPTSPPRVLISYSHDSDAHRERVLEIAQQLRADGIDAWLDSFESAPPPQGWPRWMTEQIQRAHFVILVCTPDYKRYFEGGETAGAGRGVAFEGLLLTQLLYERRGSPSIVPIYFEGQIEDIVPASVRYSTSFRLPTEYLQLLRRLGEPRSKLEPPEFAVVRRRFAPDVGDRLAGRYELLDHVANGGFAEIWRARDIEQDHVIAIKLLHGQWSHDQSRIEQFRRGARMMQRLQHPSVAPVLSEVEQDHGRYFFAMRWYAGGDLRKAIAGGMLTREQGLDAIASALEGLAHAHERGLVHRDVKPHNILIDEQGRGVISDFDLALDGTTTGTQSGLGSMLYAAPEALTDAATADARADVYGAGLCVIFVLLGEEPPPFVVLTRPQIFEQLACSERLRLALRGAVAYQRDDRTTTCAELAAAIRHRFDVTRSDAPWDLKMIESKLEASGLSISPRSIAALVEILHQNSVVLAELGDDYRSTNAPGRRAKILQRIPALARFEPWVTEQIVNILYEFTHGQLGASESTAPRVYFSFHYEADIWRVNQIRNTSTVLEMDAVGFWDAARREKVERGGSAEIKRWIDNQLLHTTVTAVLVGEHTADSEYVQYEIEQSHALGKGLLAITIHDMKDRHGHRSIAGADPFAISSLAGIYPTYDWVRDDGHLFFSAWVNEAHGGSLGWRKRLYISYASEDRSYHGIVEHWIRSGLFGSNVVAAVDSGDPRPHGEATAIRALIERRLRVCAVVLCLVGGNTYNHSWVEYELSVAASLGKPIILARIPGTSGAAPLHHRHLPIHPLDPSTLQRLI